MTKEELLNKASKLAEFSTRGTDAYRDLLKFFDSNVCITKGANRHPYADVLHEWIEGAEIECFENNSGWYLLGYFPIKSQYRIKPSEPVYEWQFYININGVVLTSEYMTQEEWSSSEIKYTSRRNEETKRVRQ